MLNRKSAKQCKARWYEWLDPSVKNFSVTIKAGESVGIVGRTGSGKSSLLVMLLRLTRQCKGRMLIGGVDTSSVSLASLRKYVAIIPQDPVLFQASVRFNLDPDGEASDARRAAKFPHASGARPAGAPAV